MTGQLIISLLVDTAYSWTRMFLALVLSIIFSWAVGIAAARNRAAERVIIPAIDVLQSIPILGFFPFVLFVFVSYFPVGVGVNLAVTFLIFTSMSWNIAFAVYEAVSSIPQQYLDLVSIEKLGLWRRLTELYIPASWSKVAYNSAVSWSVALFYLISSEIFSLGTANYAVSHGIGVDIATLSAQGLWREYAMSIGVFIFAVILTRLFFLGEFSTWSEKFKLIEEPHQVRKDPIYRFYAWINTHAVSKVFYTLAKLRVSRQQISAPTVNHTRQRGIAKRHFNPKILKAAPIFVGAAISVSILFEALRMVLSAGISFTGLTGAESNVLGALEHSFLRVWYIYALAVAVGLPLGIKVAANQKLYQTISPILQVISGVPAPAFLPPVAIFTSKLSFGGELTAAIIIFLGMVWYLIFNVMAGVRSVPSEMWEVAKLSNLKGWSLWKNILIPTVFPSFVTGSITAVGAAWNTLIVAEYFDIFSVGGEQLVLSQVSEGAGKLLNISTNSGDLLLMGLSIASMTALIMIIDVLVWRRLYKYATTRFSYKK